MQAIITLTGDLVLYKRRADNYLLIKRLARTNRTRQFPKDMTRSLSRLLRFLLAGGMNSNARVFHAL
jgi:hypothetical protein